MNTRILCAATLAASLLLGHQAHAQSDILLRLRSGAPAGDRFRVDSAGGLVVLGINTPVCTASIPASGAGNRMMWHPCKAAFRAGTAQGSEWDDASVGAYSWAGGIGSTASGQSALAFGDGSTAGGQGSVALGYRVTAAGNYSVALGYRASNNGKTGSMVMGDQSTTDSVLNQNNNELRVRYAGGIRLRTSSAANSAPGVSGNTGCDLGPGSSSWNCVSSRALKERFAPVDGEAVLARIRATPVATWSYIAEGPAVRHMGPMAEDFHAAFGLGTGSTTIGSVDIDGVNFAAARALEARTAQLRRRADASAARVATLEAELAATRRQLAELAARLARLEQR